MRLAVVGGGWAGVAARLGIEAPLPHVNASARASDYRGYYDPARAEIVAECCAEDIARFDYRFDSAQSAS